MSAFDCTVRPNPMIMHQRACLASRVLGVWLFALVLSHAPAPAQANGRYPHAQQLIEDPNDPGRLWLRVTFGLLTTKVTDPTWSWICEPSIGYMGVLDPGIGAMSDGTLLAGLANGLSVSRDQGCNWELVPGPLMGQFIGDVTVDPMNQAHAMIQATDDWAQVNSVWETRDNGATWQQLPTALDSKTVFFTLDTAPSDPNRIYLSGVDDKDQGVLVRSDDRGKSWKTFPIPGTSQSETPFLAAVHPHQPDRVFVRASAIQTDMLLYTNDGGLTWRELLRDQAQMLGFALSPDGSTVLVGFGNLPGSTTFDPRALGIWQASTSDLAFHKVYANAIYCLKWTSHGLYACGNREFQGFDLGLMPSVTFGPLGMETFTPRMLVSQVPGPLACPAQSTTTQKCNTQWPMTCMALGACPGPDAGVPPSGGGPARPDASPPPAAGLTPPPPPVGPTGPPPPKSDCGCSLRGRDGDQDRLGFLLLGMLVAASGYRRKASRRRRTDSQSNL